MSTGNITISHLSTEYVIIPVNATISGQSYNPTGDTVSFAFMSNPSASPTNTDWVAGSWDVSANSLYPYLAQCLIGPNGVITLGVSTFVIWLRVADNPETVIIQAGMLTIN